MAKHEYQREGFQPIPTPEEEAHEADTAAREIVVAQSNKAAARLLLALLAVALTTFFYRPIEALIGEIMKLFT